MSEDHQFGKQQDGSVLSEEEFQESVRRGGRGVVQCVREDDCARGRHVMRGQPILWHGKSVGRISANAGREHVRKSPGKAR